MADADCISESASSLCDEERIKRLFQACDADGDGYIDSHDLLTICRELSLEDSLDELMLQLGADAQGRISYEQFLQKRLALRPEIDALKEPVLHDTASENSQGKIDSWEWDSGARDLSPVPKAILEKFPTRDNFLEPIIQAQISKQLDEQAQRYEEQITELHSVIAELTRKLQQQRIMAITEEDEASEIGTSTHDESVVGPLEENDTDQLDSESVTSKTKILPTKPQTLKLSTSPPENNQSEFTDEGKDSLRTEIEKLKKQLNVANNQIAQLSSMENLDDDLAKYSTDVFMNDQKISIKSSTVVPVHKTNSLNQNHFTPFTVTKVAERRKLQKASTDDPLCSPNLACSSLSTAVAEHLVGDILKQCDQPETQSLEIELKRISAKLEHSKAQNIVLATTLAETKEHCDRLSILCGKYESNAIALRLALGISDRTIEAYDVLLALLETELSLNQKEKETIINRKAAEVVAKQLITHLDTYEKSDILLSPWQCINPSTSTNNEPWTLQHESRLRDHISRLKQERYKVQGTFVSLESTHIDKFVESQNSTEENQNISDLEMAVLVQELMSLREDKAELISRLYAIEKERELKKNKMQQMESHQQDLMKIFKGFKEKLAQTERILVNATQSEDGYSTDSMSTDSGLIYHIQELLVTLDHITKKLNIKLFE